MDWKKAKRDAIRNCLGDYDTADLVRLYNEMAERNNYTMIQDNTDDVLDELFGSPSDAIRVISGSDYNYAHDYLYYDVYFESFDYWSDKNSPIDLDELADWFADHDDDEGIIESDELMDFFAEAAAKECEDEDLVKEWLYGEDLVGEDWEYLFDRYLESKEEDEDDE